MTGREELEVLRQEIESTQSPTLVQAMDIACTDSVMSTRTALETIVYIIDSLPELSPVAKAQLIQVAGTLAAFELAKVAEADWPSSGDIKRPQ